MNITPANYSVSSRAKMTKELQLCNNRLARFVIDKNDKNEFNYMEAAIFKKGKNGKMFLEDMVNTFYKAKLSSEEKIKFADKAASLCRHFENETAPFADGARLCTGIMDAKNFLTDLIKAILQ